jgi:predicted ATPase
MPSYYLFLHKEKGVPITAITIENFKGIKGPVRIELKPITLLFGPNSAGKSTVIQALHYAREIFERENVDPDRTLLGGASIDLGGFDALVHRHDKSLPIKLRIDLDLTNEDLPRYVEASEDPEEMQSHEARLWEALTQVQTAWVEVSVVWSSMRGRPILRRYSVGANGSDLATIETSEDGRQVHISQLNILNPIFFKDMDMNEVFEVVSYYDHPSEEIEDLGGLFPFFMGMMDYSVAGKPFLVNPLNIGNQRAALPVWGRLLGIEQTPTHEGFIYLPEGTFTEVLSSLIVGPGELVRDALRALCYVGPLRVVPPRNFEPARTHDESRWSDGLAAWDTLFFEDEYFLDNLNRWLSGEDRLNCGYRLKLKDYKELEVDDPATLSLIQGNVLDDELSVSDHILSIPTRRRLVLWEEANGIEVQPMDIGIGISQVLPVIVAGLSAKKGFVAIEQPELHIHPALQVALGDLFIEQIGKYPDVTLLLETHSEHLMLRLLRRIRETSDDELPPGAPQLSPDSLSIYFSEKSENGIAFLPIRVDREGEFIDRWPHGFFRERAEELY